MLVLSRRTGRRIHLPDLDVVITVVGLQGGRVRLGISAPPNVAIKREGLMPIEWDAADNADQHPAAVERCHE